jgi:hypothetical protein
MRAWSDPRLVAVIEAEIGDALNRDKPSIGNTAGKRWWLVAEQPSLNRRVNAIGAEQDVERSTRAVVEPDLDAVSPVGEAGKSVIQMNALVRKYRRDHRQQIATVKRHMWRTVELLAQWVERRLLKCAPVLPAALMREERAHAVAVEPRAEAKAVQDAHSVRAHVDAAANLGQFRGLFIEVHVEAGLPQCEGRAEAADSSADDPNTKHNQT